MKPIKFPEANVTFAENQPEYFPLPACRDEGGMGQVISCWKLSWYERLRVLFFGEMWMSLCMFGRPLTPSLLSTSKADMFAMKPDWMERTRIRLQQIWSKVVNKNS